MLRTPATVLWLIAGTIASLAQNAPTLSQDEATQIVTQWLNNCVVIPLGNFTLSMNQPQLTQYIKQFEARGFVSITPINQSTGNIWDDINRIGQNAANGLAALVHVELLPSIDRTKLCTMPNGSPGIPPGIVSVAQVVRFQESSVPGLGGVPNTVYLMQAVINRQPSPYALQLNPGLPPTGNFQTTFQYNFFNHQWVMQNPQVF